ncbi:uncharacterized protein MONOS_17064 [Monocercomonoides exilis]|uniref:uncharacterized protein n=1 Tax=Monocercomonoides exilis TaxID=2049356 RepID=UPI003559C0AA|nr:hypothetical protein MONOS_17064 [Monocercomonoides exilis]
MEKMNTKELETSITMDVYENIDYLMDCENIAEENIILLLKLLGYRKELYEIKTDSFKGTTLSATLWSLINEANSKYEMNSTQVDFCECYLINSNYVFVNKESHLINYVPYILKVALKKRKNKKEQAEAEIALMSLCKIEQNAEIEKELFLDHIKEIIQFHQKHNNLSHLAYQRAWEFLIKRLNEHKELENVIVNELHFYREAFGELEILKQCVNWTKNETGRYEIEEMLMLRWVNAIKLSLWNSTWRLDIFSKLVDFAVSFYRLAKDNQREITGYCANALSRVMSYSHVNFNDLLKNDLVDFALEEIMRPTLDEYIAPACFLFFDDLASRIDNYKSDIVEDSISELTENLENSISGIEDEYKYLNQINEKLEIMKNAIVSCSNMLIKEKIEIAWRRMKIESFEKFEEEGYEDVIISYYWMIRHRRYCWYNCINIADLLFFK